MKHDRDEEAQRLLEAVGMGELHGDGNASLLAERLADKGFARRVDILEAIRRCREWRQEAEATGPVWQRVREGVFALNEVLRLQIQQAGRVLGAWGSAAQDILEPLTWPAGAQPGLVALGDEDDLQQRSAMVSLPPGEGGIKADVCVFSRKDRSVAVEIRVSPLGAGAGGSAELWQGSEPLQRVPVVDGMAVFAQALAPGRYDIVVRVSGRSYELAVEVA
jgi:hypothetical protein